MRTHVFSGPSLPSVSVAELLPGAVPHPPVRHGDLLALPAGAGDRVVLLDGVFFQSASVRHKEITELIRAGIEVWGAASMGALRAAELQPQGMRGAGTVYRLYALGLLERDDEVALVHTEPDHGSRPLTVALVSVRVLARRLFRTRRLTAADERAVVAAAEQLHFTERSWRQLLDTAALSPAGHTAIEAAVGAPPGHWDVKAADAARLLRYLARHPVPDCARIDTPRTHHVERWHRRAHPDAERLVTAAALYACDYPCLHRRTILTLIAGGPDPELEERALSAAAHRGLVPAGADPRPVLARLVTTYRWAGGLPPTPPLASAIAASPGGPRLTQLIADAARLNAELAARGRDVANASRAALLRHLSRRWGVPDVGPALAERGFRDVDELIARARWFTPQLVLTDPEPVTLHPAIQTIQRSRQGGPDDRPYPSAQPTAFGPGSGCTAPDRL